LSATSFAKSELPPDLAKRLPHYPVPAAILGRLAVSQSLQKQGLGKFLIFDAFNRVVQTSQQLGIHALLIDAKYPHIVPIYTKYGFQPFPSTPLRLFISVKTLAKA
jgi:predicted GNAT family N-acyltransferase